MRAQPVSYPTGFSAGKKKGSNAVTDISAIKRSLSANLDRVVRNLLPNAKRKGYEYEVGSIQGESGDSLKIHVGGEKQGIWKDFATNQGGDLLDLWCAVRHLSLAEAISEAKGYLGIGNIEIEPVRKKKWLKPVFKPQGLPTLSPAAKYLLSERKLTEHTLGCYKVDSHGDEIIFPSYRGKEFLFLKYLKIDRPNNKKIMRVAKDCQPILFGWQAVPRQANTLVLSEGEIDAMTLSQYFPDYACLSIPLGAGPGSKHEWIEHEHENLQHFGVIYLCFDQDEPGQIAAQEIANRLGTHRCKLVKLPHKDANECLQNNVSEDELSRCFNDAALLSPKELVSAETFMSEIHRLFDDIGKYMPGTYHLPWVKSANLIEFIPHGISVWTGINGHGKTRALGQILCHQINEMAKVCILSLEMRPARFLGNMIKQITAAKKPSITQRESAMRLLAGSLWIYNALGTVNPDRMIEIFRYAHQVYGIDVFLIDSFLRCGISEEDYTAQKSFIEKLCDLKNEFPIHLHIIMHPRKGADENKMPGKMDIKGSGSITDLADNCFSIWRNRPKEDEKASQEALGLLSQKRNEPDCFISCNKNRHGEWEGTFGLWYDKESGQYVEKIDQKPSPMI